MTQRVCLLFLGTVSTWKVIQNFVVSSPCNLLVHLWVWTCREDSRDIVVLLADLWIKAAGHGLGEVVLIHKWDPHVGSCMLVSGLWSWLGCSNGAQQRCYTWPPPLGFLSPSEPASSSVASLSWWPHCSGNTDPYHHPVGTAEGTDALWPLRETVWHNVYFSLLFLLVYICSVEWLHSYMYTS